MNFHRLFFFFWFGLTFRSCNSVKHFAIFYTSEICRCFLIICESGCFHETLFQRAFHMNCFYVSTNWNVKKFTDSETSLSTCSCMDLIPEIQKYKWCFRNVPSNNLLHVSRSSLFHTIPVKNLSLKIKIISASWAVPKSRQRKVQYHFKLFHLDKLRASGSRLGTSELYKPTNWGTHSRPLYRTCI